MVEEEFSPGVADSVICGAALENDGAYTSVGDYDPKELAALVDSLNALAGLDRGEIFRRFGRHMFWHHWIERPHWFRNVHDVFTFAARYDELLADDIGTLYERTAPKRISVVCESASNGMAIIAYRARVMPVEYMVGWLEGCVENFSDDVDIGWERLSEDGRRGRITLARRAPTEAVKRLEKRLERERRARAQAERIIEEKSREVFEASRELQDSSNRLRSSEAVLRGIMDNVSDGIITMSEDGIIETFNYAAELIFGHTEERIIGQPVSVLMAEPDSHRHQAYVSQYLQSGDRHVLGRGPREVVGLHADGSALSLDLSVSEMWVDERRVFVGAVRDIADRKKAEEERRQTQKMEAVGQLTAGLAHEFNNMLVPIIGLTELVAEDMPEDTPDRKNLDRVLDTAARAQDLVASILAFSRKGTHRREAMSLDDTVMNTLKLVTATTPSTARIAADIRPLDGVFLGDPTEIHQIMFNLVGNATHALGGAVGTIRIGLRPETLDEDLTLNTGVLRPGRYGILTVSDTGAGMDADTVGRIFEPFFTTREVGTGTGMGLALIHAIVERSQGAIGVDSAPGKGTTLEIWLPLAEGEEPAPPAADAPAAQDAETVSAST
jgi:PAS domain S-box-containing protein